MIKKHLSTLYFVSLFLGLSLNVQASTLLLDGGASNLGPGDPLNLSVGVQHNEAPTNVDVYLALVMPEGSILFFSLTEEPGILNSHVGDASPENWTPLLTNLELTTGMDTGLIPIFNYTLAGTEPSGDYQWLLATTPVGNRELIDITSYSFKVSSRNISNLQGTWSGSWTNDTFGSTGAASLSIENNQAPGSIKLTIDLDGFVGGLLDPDPEALISTISNNGDINYSGQIDLLGPLTFTLGNDGQITINANNIDVSGFDSFTATGTLSESQLNLNYTVTFSGGSTATGTVTGSK